MIQQQLSPRQVGQSCIRRYIKAAFYLFQPVFRPRLATTKVEDLKDDLFEIVVTASRTVTIKQVGKRFAVGSWAGVPFFPQIIQYFLLNQSRLRLVSHPKARI